jgi:hypothetical protein
LLYNASNASNFLDHIKQRFKKSGVDTSPLLEGCMRFTSDKAAEQNRFTFVMCINRLEKMTELWRIALDEDK